MATLLSTLKLVSATRVTKATPDVERRRKLIKKIMEQIEIAKAQAAGTLYQPTQFKHVINADTGKMEYKQVPKKVRTWWWKNDAGTVNLVVRYGTKVIDLAKGKNGIELENDAALLPTLELIKQAVEAGELDAAIKAVSKVVELKLD